MHAVTTAEAAKIFAKASIPLFENKFQTVGTEKNPKEVHLIRLGIGIVLLEGIILGYVEEVTYLIHEIPLNPADVYGSPCRATLIRNKRINIVAPHEFTSKTFIRTWGASYY